VTGVSDWFNNLIGWEFTMQTEEEKPTLYIPPLNFGLVQPGVYRSGFPIKLNFPYMTKIGIKTIIYISPEPYLDKNLEFYQNNGITIKQYSLEGNKEPFIAYPEESIAKVIVDILDKRNHPVLIHCTRGKFRTGVIVGCLRKMQFWSLTAIFDEFRRYGGPEIRMLDQQYIECFDPNNVVYSEEYKPSWI
jgi:tyrosine-protein phosphatase SIW14